MSKHYQRPVRPRSHNRLAAIMMHTKRYAFKGTTRLAEETGLSISTVDRLIHGRSRPSFRSVDSVVRALEGDLGKKLHLGEIFSIDGIYPTSSICTLLGCNGCLPERAYNQIEKNGKFVDSIRPGAWTGDNQEQFGEHLDPIQEIR